MKRQLLQTSNYTIELSVGDATEHLPIVIRKHPRSRRMVIRYQPIAHHVSLTLPRYCSIKQGLRFVEEKRGWLEQQLMEKSQHIPFTDGQVIPVLGQHYKLTHVGGRGVITIDGERILVHGDAEFMERRVREWLKRRAREEILTLAATMTEKLGVKLKRVSLRDTSSRWGSCSHRGDLSFSWRLILAPREVLDYLVAHEVAHIVEHNHSAAFWKLVERLYPDYEKSQRWLKAHGSKLYSYG